MSDRVRIQTSLSREDGLVIFGMSLRRRGFRRPWWRCVEQEKGDSLGDLGGVPEAQRGDGFDHLRFGLLRLGLSETARIDDFRTGADPTRFPLTSQALPTILKTSADERFQLGLQLMLSGA
jgi:Tetracyclin repressor-like, C-terminal domain